MMASDPTKNHKPNHARRVRRRREEMRESISRLTQSIEVIEWCILGIASVMAVALVILVLVVWKIGNEAQRIKGEVEQIKGEAEKIVRQIEHEADTFRDKIQHPLRSIGGAIGGQPPVNPRHSGSLTLDSFTLGYVVQRLRRTELISY